MARTLDKSFTTDVSATGTIGSFGSSGHYIWSFQATTKSAGTSPSATVKLQGSNDGSNWTDMGSLSFTAAETQHGTVTNESWKYVRLQLTAVNNLTVDTAHVWATGAQA